jgi:hypothetical protein
METLAFYFLPWVSYVFTCKRSEKRVELVVFQGCLSIDRLKGHGFTV